MFNTITTTDIAVTAATCLLVWFWLRALQREAEYDSGGHR